MDPRQLVDDWPKAGAAERHAAEITREVAKTIADLARSIEEKDLKRLLETVERDWTGLDPAIFGTLLERALDAKERHTLGAHFTPRAYVERLVRPTLEEPLREAWENVQAAVREMVVVAGPAPARAALSDTACLKQAKAREAKLDEAREALRAFLRELAGIRVLDPACGTGNFLYVALDVLKRIESEVLAALHDVGVPLGACEARVTPAQFLGIEVKPWAKEIAELVLWIGFLQWHDRMHGEAIPPPQPALVRDVGIECRDALLAWDGASEPNVRTYPKPRKAAWPRADFIIGNPPYIGARKIRSALGDRYVDALRSVYDDVPDTADLVMYWWHKAALAVEAGSAQRFGLITTSSIVQDYSRGVLDQHVGLPGCDGAALCFAIAEHPWVETRDGADVTVAMTVMALRKGAVRSTMEAPPASPRQAVLGRVVPGTWSKTGARVEYASVPHINSSLTAGSRVRGIARLRANAGVCFQGVIPAGDGFKLASADLLPFGIDPARLPQVVRSYVIGRDLVQRSTQRLIIDFFGCSEDDAAEGWPALFQHLRERVLPERARNHRASYRDKWWLFAEPRPAMRRALRGLVRFVATPYTAKFRLFVFVDVETLPDAMVYAIASEDAAVLGVLSSKAHALWALAAGGRLGVGNDARYTSNATFAPFPFPAFTPAQQQRIRDLGEALDAHRKRRQTEHPDLTITGMYNVLEKLRKGEELSGKDTIVHQRGLVSALKQIHDDLDAAVFDAYGWPPDLADEQILQKLVDLNAERADEERKGLVRWLRPDFQSPRAAPLL